MDTTNVGAEPGMNLDPDVTWRAIENETLQNIAYLGIIAWERRARSCCWPPPSDIRR